MYIIATFTEPEIEKEIIIFWSIWQLQMESSKAIIHDRIKIRDSPTLADYPTLTTLGNIQPLLPHRCTLPWDRPIGLWSQFRSASFPCSFLLSLLSLVGNVSSFLFLMHRVTLTTTFFGDLFYYYPHRFLFYFYSQLLLFLISQLHTPPEPQSGAALPVRGSIRPAAPVGRRTCEPGNRNLSPARCVTGPWTLEKPQ